MLTEAPNYVRRFMQVFWLVFMAIPVLQTFDDTTSGATRVIAVVGAVAVVATYLPLFRHKPGDPTDAVDLAIVVTLEALAVGLTIGLGPAWALAFVFSTVGGAVRLPRPWDVRVVLAAPVLVIGCSYLSGVPDVGDQLGYAASATGVGALMLTVARLRQLNLELTAGRAALADRAVAEERVRFARDLHDLLGHSLSVIALKSELAGRLLERDAGAARAHVTEVEAIAREALVEVREAVSGYRRPTLAGELAGARLALEAAGVRAELSDRTDGLDPDREAVLAWAVREGVTNVIRHAAATCCRVEVTDSGVEVRDDGRARARGTSSDPLDLPGDGNGLAGLRERAAALQGSVVAGALDGGGYRLAVRLGEPA